jgi:capsid protein
MASLLDNVRSFVGARLGKAPRRKGVDAAEVAARFHAKYQELRAKYDAVQPGGENDRHWQNADGLSAEAAASPAVRHKLMRRARYEVQENNCHGKGILLKHAFSVVGRCPKMQVESDNEEFNDLVEKWFGVWARAVKLGQKLRTMAMAKTCDGEAFAVMFTNRKRKGVQLDLRLVEAEQVATPDLPWGTPNYIDGIKFDGDGNPVHYDILKHHPGGNDFSVNPLDYQHYRAADVLHWFREDRGNQKRGVCEFAPALPLFAMLRRFTLATIAAAETAADFAGVLHTNVNNLDDGPEETKTLDLIDVEMRSLLTLPEGWDMRQFAAEHPATTFDMFERVILTQMAQCVLQPYNIAAGDSSDHNFASGRLDHRLYDTYVGVERYDAECGLLAKLAEAWYREFRLLARMTGLYTGDMPEFEELEITWLWDSADMAVDPNREANGENTRLGNGSLTFAELLGGRGRDWRKSFKQTAKELGLTVPELQKKIANKLFESPAMAAAMQEGGPEGSDDEDDTEVGDGQSAEGGKKPVKKRPVKKKARSKPVATAN